MLKYLLLFFMFFITSCETQDFCDNNMLDYFEGII